ncbi:hypothetical protein BJF84_04365 [Rhodococcus sp. CUA-806]|nr:hypothetical protein BJF84_04365 [Rhodococcus sp. CUA-806]
MFTHEQAPGGRAQPSGLPPRLAAGLHDPLRTTDRRTPNLHRSGDITVGGTDLGYLGALLGFAARTVGPAVPLDG